MLEQSRGAVVRCAERALDLDPQMVEAQLPPEKFRRTRW
jgi:hypothetical protein